MSDVFDVLVIGAGPAGMAAALAAAKGTARVGIIDDNPAPGGQIWRDGVNARLPRRATEQRAAVSASPAIRAFSATRVIALEGPDELLLEDPERGFLLRYRHLILCTGARELLLPFPGWTLPGVTGAGGLQALIKGGLPVRDQRVVIAGSGPLLLASAASAKKAGATVAAIAEQASRAHLAHFALGLAAWPGKALQAVQLFDRHYQASSHVVAALGDQHVEAVRISQNGQLREIDCERLACGFGLVANTGLAEALGCELSNRVIAVNEWQATRVHGLYAAGECTGIGGSELASIEGAIAGHAAVGEQHKARALWPQRRRWQRFADRLHTTFALDPRLKTLAEPDTLVCRCEDIPLADLVGKPDWRSAKLLTRCGMGACQGRLCGAACEFLFGWPQPVPRPPFSPARIGTLALPSSPGGAVQ